MNHLQTRLEALEQRTRTVERQLRWGRGLACSLVVLAPRKKMHEAREGSRSV